MIPNNLLKPRISAQPLNMLPSTSRPVSRTTVPVAASGREATSLSSTTSSSSFFPSSTKQFKLHRHTRTHQQHSHSPFIVRAERDFYSVLGVARGATKKEIKSAYRQKARTHHPDVSKEPDAEERFKDISAAYEVLSDDEKKRIYDQYGEAGLKGGGPGFGGAGAAGMGGFSDAFDIFEQFFGGGFGGGGGGFGGSSRANRNRPMPGDSQRYDLKIDFLEAVFGCSKEIDISRLENCGTCSGSGVKPGTTPVTCSTCGGAGQVAQVVRTPLGVIQQVAPCPACGGTGQSSTPCSTCAGDGRVRGGKRISIRVPPGVSQDSRLRVRGEGDSGKRGGEPGDLYVFISVKPHPELRREDINIHSDVEISYVDAILGATVQITTVDGKVDLKIPGGTQPGTTLVMAKRGVPKLGASSSRGDHLVHVKVKIPKKMSEKTKTLVEELKKLDQEEMEDSKAGGRKWFG